jgi:mRNA-degrading endonuclease toxin of MazEF toxin-antitoxin module
MCEQVRTISKDRLIDKSGTVSSKDMQKINTCLAIAIAGSLEEMEQLKKACN